LRFFQHQASSILHQDFSRFSRISRFSIIFTP
jgi:hypothetical protein